MKPSNMVEKFSLNVATADRLGIGLFRYQISPQERFVFASSALAKIFGYASAKQFEANQLPNLIVDPSDKKSFNKFFNKNPKLTLFHTNF